MPPLGGGIKVHNTVTRLLLLIISLLNQYLRENLPLVEAEVCKKVKDGEEGKV